MKSICIAGRTGKDAELRRLQDGTPVLAFPVAVDDGFGDKKRTLWFDCSMFGQRGTKLQSYLAKGTPVTVSGDFGTREYEGKTYLTVRVNDVTMQGGGRSDDRAPARQEQSSYAEESGGGAARMADDMSDEIPFLAEWRV